MTDKTSTASKLKILYIAGWGRSGTTILGNVLAQMPGVFHGGELWFLGQERWRENSLCGCGKAFDRCELWSPVIDKLEVLFGKGALDDLQSHPIKTRYLAALMITGHLPIPRPREEHILGVFRQLYGLAASESRANVVIDSSKSPIYARLVQGMEDKDLYIVHVVRDPRATAFSWGRWKYDASRDVHLHRRGPLEATLLWMIWNGIIEAIWNHRRHRPRYLRVRYEDFAERPQEWIRRILDFVGEPASGNVVSDIGEVYLHPAHTVAGNPIRLEHGQGRIRKDEEWRSKMRWYHKGLVVGLTWPFLLHYEYPFWS